MNLFTENCGWAEGFEGFVVDLDTEDTEDGWGFEADGTTQTIPDHLKFGARKLLDFVNMVGSTIPENFEPHEFEAVIRGLGEEARKLVLEVDPEAKRRFDENTKLLEEMLQTT